jgi:RNA processing factor Prp31
MESNSLFFILKSIVNGDISSFSDLKSHLVSSKVTITKDELDILFNTIKKVHWGAFAEINHEDFPDLWKELVIPDPQYPTMYGDLKKSMVISNIFIALLDIHGYTAFCQKTRKNITSLQRLDKFVEANIKETTKKEGILAIRERGDEILLIGTNALSILNATFKVVDLFSKPMKVNDDVKKPSEETFLPAFSVSGGIAGGYTFSPMIIGKNGDLQGFIINFAARLQSRANTIAPKSTKIVIDQIVYHKLISSIPQNKNNEILKKIKFLYHGEIKFKGGKLKVYEIYSKDEEKYKDLIAGHIKKLNESIKNNEWQSNVLPILCDIGMLVAENMPRIEKEITIIYDDKLEKITVSNDYISTSFLHIKYAFKNSKDFHSFIRRFRMTIDMINKIDSFDPLIKEYCNAIYEVYLNVFLEYNKILTSVVHDKPSNFLTIDEMETFLTYESIKGKYESIIKKLNSSPEFADKRNIIWLRAFNNIENSINFSIYSGKK